jgi:hypothetical protein
MTCHGASSYRQLLLDFGFSTDDIARETAIFAITKYKMSNNINTIKIQSNTIKYIKYNYTKNTNNIINKQ